ncbi:SDR family NAD(P)-dependent oxidoreductase [Vibrio gigantis]|uniref:SDR family NAD(P)-dependent oxidoreductase n=1 Tax=Vibrio gigantis TaxID=296199 RepID=UPI001BFE80C0|nr:SDR family oxidoreductase [Vibrio gigantis]
MHRNIFSLQGMSVLVTGATGYLGKEMCFGLGEAGAHVLVNSRSEERALELVEELVAKGFSAEKAIFDVGVKVDIDSFFEQFEGDVNVIVNNAYFGQGGTIKTTKGDEYIDSYRVVVDAAHYIVNRALPKLRASVKSHGYASIINIGSMYGVVSPDLRIYPTAEGTNPPFYGAAKAALIQWTKYAACEFGSEGIRFNSISPGPFPNPTPNSEQFISSLAEKVPLGRVGQSAEIKGPIVFLASSASSFVNGANLSVDGGWTVW